MRCPEIKYQKMLPAISICLIFFLLLHGCIHSTVLTLSRTARLKEKFEKYQKMVEANLDKNGWVKHSCDSALFTGLYIYSGGKSDIYLAESKEEPGRWYRTPSHDCYPDRSGSTISRDMYDGILLALWKKKDLKAVERMIDYGEKKFWLIGDGSFSRVLILPPMQGTIYFMRHSLGGKFDLRQIIPYIWFPYSTGFERHLNVVHLYIRSLLRNGMNELARIYLRKEISVTPNNALIHATFHKYSDGDQSRALDILLDEKYFPSDRLPESRDRCTDYLWQRNEDEWKPCPEEKKVHPGVDFLFAAAIVLGK